MKKFTYIYFFALSAILLTVIQQPYNLSFLAWVALVPFVFAALSNVGADLSVCPGRTRRFAPTMFIILAAYIIGILYWLGNLYWLIPITIPGWIAACAYMAVYWPIVVISLRFCVQRKIPIWFALPILIVGEEALRGWLFGWRFLAHSQFSNISLIQIADTFGTSGVSFVIAMVNGLICDLIYSRNGTKTQRIRIIYGCSITIFIIAATLFYGRYRINQTPQFTEDGPKIGVVQSNVPVKAGEDTEPFEKIFLDQLSDSRKALVQGEPSLIIWPETMVETMLDDSYLQFVTEEYASKIIHNALLRHSNEGVYVLVGAFGGEAELEGEQIKIKTKHNTAFLYEPNQAGPRQQYSKIHLVPFGEYMPLKKELPFLYKLLLAMTPYDYDYTLDAGKEYTIFKMRVGDETYRFAVSICFEDTLPGVCRRLVAEDGFKQADWLVNISNDGWFVRKINNKIKASSELSQHMAICVFRAIENRVAVIRCANTGISCMIDSLGNIKDGYLSGTLNEKVSQRTGQAGWFVDNVKIDKRVSAFSKHGQLLTISCGICFILSAAMSIYKMIGTRKVKVEANDKEKF